MKNAALAKISYDKNRCQEEMQKAIKFLPKLKWGGTDLRLPDSSQRPLLGDSRRGIRARSKAKEKEEPSPPEAIVAIQKVKSGFGLWRVEVSASERTGKQERKRNGINPKLFVSALLVLY